MAGVRENWVHYPYAAQLPMRITCSVQHIHILEFCLREIDGPIVYIVPSNRIQKYAYWVPIYVLSNTGNYLYSVLAYPVFADNPKHLRFKRRRKRIRATTTTVAYFRRLRAGLFSRERETIVNIIIS